VNGKKAGRRRPAFFRYLPALDPFALSIVEGPLA
jgi:hypothetical protein